MGPWKHLRAMCLGHRKSTEADNDRGMLNPIEYAQNDSPRTKVVAHYPDQYHVLKISSENELFFYKFMPADLRKHVPQLCATVTPDRDAPRLLPFACHDSVEKRGHYDEFDYTRRNGGLPNTGKTLLVIRDIKADFIEPCWANFELGFDNIYCLRMSGMTLNFSKGRLTKSESRISGLSSIKIKLETFFADHFDLIELIIYELEKIIMALIHVNGICFHGTSILIAYDAAARPSSHFRVEVKLLSFGNVTLSSEKSLYVLNGLITLREILRSISEGGHDMV